jgi:2-polyprenyl-6-methoxyphenol hydroxylase-like FAD-dependent oxidoreductase
VQILDELFPGLLYDFVADGAPVIDKPSELYFALAGYKFCQGSRFTPPVTTYQAGRPYLEGQVRARVRALSNVELIDQCRVIDLVGSKVDNRVTGARIARRGGDGERLLNADLVIDATGRGGGATRWLEAMGYDKPAEDRLEVDIRYVSRHLRLRPESMDREKALIVGPEPGRPTGAFFISQEDKSWILTLFGYRGFHPPTDHEEFVAFAESVVPPHVFAAIRDAEPCDDPVTYRYRASVRRRYERLDRFPAGLLIFGDALCSFNPIYGQGMATAALQAVALRDCLVLGPEDLAPRFFKTAGRRIEVPWQMSCGADLSLPEVDAPRSLPTRIANAYIGRTLKAAEHDWAVAERFMRVAWLIAPPTLLLRPDTVARVVVGNWRRRAATRLPALPPHRQDGRPRQTPSQPQDDAAAQGVPLRNVAPGDK